ncbi:eCIS core domain-containing protein [Tahibacter amnicola]|uniref:DUF4157 domain-containing protein n=1 Tax=Tahibacter amnicola TaxID=2976241 RepID=A0ABY6BPG9_9GAMM|nr:DUF4157 domain-containing protein [Tahibacter amnicola]UXI70300.1 DUF4157 domain-containing protein [Tahibacter amnicola]
MGVNPFAGEYSGRGGMAGRVPISQRWEFLASHHSKDLRRPPGDVPIAHSVRTSNVDLVLDRREGITMNACVVPRVLLYLLACGSWFASTGALAGGLIGDAIDLVAPGAGKTLDDAHRQVKDAIPPYKIIEEGGTRLVNETLVQASAPALERLIEESRDDALRRGVQPIPHAIRRNLTGFVAEGLLNRVRYRVRGGGDLTLQVNSIRYGKAQAITLEYIVVFKEVNDALYNPTLWAHELSHVEQFQKWGIRDFAIRYLRNHHSVEADAYAEQSRYVAWVGWRNSQQTGMRGRMSNADMVNRPVSPFAHNSPSSTCGTAVITCQVNGSAPVGTPCWCNTAHGAATGSLLPVTVAVNRPVPVPPLPPPSLPAPLPPPPPPSVSFPSGYGMQVCGCWGPNPPPMAPEPRCASKQVRLAVCPGLCAPGHPLYGYVCS